MQQAAEVTPLQLLIFINPFGGTGKAEQLFDEHVRPMFDMAEVQSTIIVTSEYKGWGVCLHGERVTCVNEGRGGIDVGSVLCVILGRKGVVCVCVH